MELPRNQSALQASVTVLRETAPVHPDEPYVPLPHFDAAVLRLDEPFMDVQCGTQVQPNAALKIETPGALWLGEVESCTASGNAWVLRVRLRHVLRDFETLARLAERFGVAASKEFPVQV